MIRTKVGSISGTRQAPIVTITVFDDSHGTLDYSAALAACVGAVPATIMGAALKTSEITISEKSRDAITFEVGYTGPGRNVLFISSGVQTKAKKVHHFIAPVGVYTDSSGTSAASSYTNYKWKLDRLNSSSEFNAGKALTVEPLSATTQWNFQTSQSFLTDTYFDLIQDYVYRGVCNNATFLGRPAGSLQFVSFTAQQKDLLEWELNFGIAYFKPQINFFVDDLIKVPLLRGCDYYWLKETEVLDTGEIQPKVIAAIVGQAWPLADFSKINLPFQGTLTSKASPSDGSIQTIYDPLMVGYSGQVLIYWDGGRRQGNLASASSAGISFNSGSGDALPPVGTNTLIAKATA